MVAQLSELSQQEQDLVNRAKAATSNAYANYSHCLLYTSRVIVLIVNIYIVVHDGVAYILREEVVVDEWFGGF